jgi:membrane protein implicated in regulation of membrane protease activity
MTGANAKVPGNNIRTDSIMRKKSSKRAFLILNIFTTIVEEAVLVTVMLVVLPHLGINVSIWLAVLLAFAWAVWSYISYRLGRRSIDQSPVIGAEALVGDRGITTTPLMPKGYVKVGSEFWQARSTCGNIDTGVEVIIVEVKGLTLLVTIMDNATAGINHQATKKTKTKIPGER